MEVFEAIAKRRTVRKYTGAPVSCEDLEKIFNAGRLAASGMNNQPWVFIAITDPEMLRRLRVPEDHWMQKAGAVIAVVMDPASRWWIEDAAASVQNMLLACTTLGYGACWLEGYTSRNEEAFKKILNIPESLRLFTLVAIGVPDEQPIKEKKSLDDVLRWQRYTS
jgi:nitroreductase